MGSSLDYATLYFCLTITAVLVAAAMLYVWRVHSNDPAIRYWALGFLFCALGCLPPALSGAIPAWSIKISANLLGIASSVFVYLGTALFLGKRPRWRLLILVDVPCILLIFLATFVQDQWSWRVLGYTVSNGLAISLIAWDLWSAPSGPHTKVYRAAGTCWALFASGIVLRCIGVWLAGPEATPQYLDPFLIAYFLSLFAALVFGSIGYLLMSSQRLQLRLDELASCDELTGILNRRAFQAALDSRKSRSSEPQPWALMVLDIDFFKRINDTHGHAGGDLLLRETVAVLERQLRGGDLFARAGGEEFWLLLKNAPEAEANRIAERLRLAVETNRLSFGGADLHATISIGLVTGVGELADLSHELARADAALYAAKSQGRNRVVRA